MKYKMTTQHWQTPLVLQVTLRSLWATETFNEINNPYGHGRGHWNVQECGHGLGNLYGFGNFSGHGHRPVSRNISNHESWRGLGH